MKEATINELCKKIEEKKGINSEIINSIVSFSLKEMKEEMNKYNNLIICIPGLFSFFYSKKRLEYFKEAILLKLGRHEGEKLPSFNKAKTAMINEMSNEMLEETLIKINILLNKYKDYIDEKKIIRDNNKAYREAKKNNMG